jgi:hypothetical protein
VENGVQNVYDGNVVLNMYIMEHRPHKEIGNYNKYVQESLRTGGIHAVNDAWHVENHLFF